MTEKKEEKKEEINEPYVLKEVVTQRDVGIGKNDGSDGVFTEKGLLLEILNKLDKIEKAVA